MSDFLADAQAVALAAAKEAGEVLLKHFRQNLISEIKSGNIRNIVTNADNESDEVIRKLILKSFPEHGIVSEESSPKPGNYVWYIDPLDGTTNYSRGNSVFCISIALGKGIDILVGTTYNPLAGEMYSAIKGKGAFLNGKSIKSGTITSLDNAMVCCDFGYENKEREIMLGMFKRLLMGVKSVRFKGSGALTTAEIASGRVDGYVRAGSSPWDYAASTLIIREAGGVVTDFNGKAWQLDSENIVAAATPVLHKELLKAVEEA